MDMLCRVCEVGLFECSCCEIVVASELGIVGATTNERCPLVGVGNGNGVQRAGVRAKAGVELP